MEVPNTSKQGFWDKFPFGKQNKAWLASKSKPSWHCVNSSFLAVCTAVF